jgi:hypothetical protein
MRSRLQLKSFLRLTDRRGLSNASTTSWGSLFPQHHRVNAWSTSIPSLDDIFLDKSSRYLLQLLNTLYLDLERRESFDRATTARCNRILDQLNASKLLGRANRADEILRNMELFYVWGKEDRVKPPLPDGETYFKVLRIFASDPSSPDRALAIVESMMEKYTYHGQLDVLPNVVHWNQVLSCWAISNRSDKAINSAKILVRMKSENIFDISSYFHVLRACHDDALDDESKTLAAHVAIKVFKDLRRNQKELQPTEYIYSTYLSTLSYISDVKLRSKEAVSAFKDCEVEGYVNQYVINIFRRIVSPSTFHRTIGKNLCKDSPTAIQLLSRISHQSTRNVRDAKNSP